MMQGKGLPLAILQSVKKVEVQEALPPAGVIGAEPLTLVPQHFSRKPEKRCLRAWAANLGFFDRLKDCHWQSSVCQKRSRIAAFFDIIGDNNRSR